MFLNVYDYLADSLTNMLSFGPNGYNGMLANETFSRLEQNLPDNNNTLYT